MGNIFKHIFWIAPVSAVVIFITFMMLQKHDVEMQTDSTEFDRDWNESMATFAKTDANKQKYLARAAVKQQQLSSAQIDLAAERNKMKLNEKQMDKAIEDIDKQLQEQEGGK